MPAKLTDHPPAIILTLVLWLVLGSPAFTTRADEPDDAAGVPLAVETEPADVVEGDPADLAEGETEATAAAADAVENALPPPMMPMFQRWGFGPWGGRGRWFVQRAMALPVPLESAEAGDAPRSVTLPENGDLRRRLEKIQGQWKDGQFADVARNLGALLQDAEVQDFFLSRDEERRDGGSFHAEVRRLIATLPPEGREAYRVQYSAVASQRLAEALSAGGEEALRDVARRFPCTSAGNEAWYRLAHLLWEHGRPAAAAACLSRIEEDPEAVLPLEPGFSQLRTACRERAGRQFPVHESDWLDFRGDGARNRESPAAAPQMAPRWTQVVVAAPQSLRALDAALESHGHGGGTSIPQLAPLVIGERVLLRTSRGVAVFDRESGQLLWQHPADDDLQNSGIERRMWQDDSAGGMSADTECVFLVEDSAGGGAFPRLTARSHQDDGQGRLRWQVGGTDGGDEPQLAAAFFLGPPLPWQGRLYVLVEWKGGIALAALEPRSGRLEWSQELARLEEPQGADSVRRRAGAVPTIAGDETIICPTSGGAVIAVDLTTQSLNWAYRYARRAAPGPSPGDDQPHFAALQGFQEDRWLDSSATVAGDCVLLTPPDSPELHCLELASGRPRWTRPCGDGLFVGTASTAMSLIVGRTQVQGLRLEDGRPAWETPLLLGMETVTAGRGVASPERYFLPVSAGRILEIDRQRGTLVAEHRSPRELPLGNLVWQRGAFISQGPFHLQLFDERDAAERAIAEALEHNPRDAAAWLRKGELASAGGAAGAGLEEYREAHRLAPDRRTRARLTASLLDALRAAPESDRPALQRELDDLAQP